MKTASVLIAILVLAALASPAPAEDRVVLKTGAILTGEIVKLDDVGVTIDIPDLGRIFVSRSRIERIEGKRAERPEPEPQPGPLPGNEMKTPPGETPPARPDVAPATRPLDSAEVEYSEIKAGQKLLLILEGEDHGGWRDSGLRMIAEIPAVGESRFQAVFAPEDGVLGNVWLPREKFVRAVRVAGYPDRRLLFFHGIEVGSWIEGDLEDGTDFAGQLAAVSPEGRVTVCTPRGSDIETTEIHLGDLRTLRAAVRSDDLKARIDHLLAGEPVALVPRDGDGEIRGRIIDLDQVWLRLEVADESGEGFHVLPVFRGTPLVGLRTLPEPLRSSFSGLVRGAWLTVHTEEETPSQSLRTEMTGTLLDADVETIRMLTPRGEIGIPVASVTGIDRPDAEAAERRVAVREASDADNVLPILPGQTREEAERRLPGGREGIDVLYDDEDRIARVFCRSPFPGPVFGIRPGQSFAQALKGSDLTFDTQVTSKEKGEISPTVMVSHTLAAFLVKAYVSESGNVLAVEICPRSPPK